MSDYTNAMEELARASLTIQNLVDGYEGRVELDISDFDSAEELVVEIHEAQVYMAQTGWTRCPEVERLMPYAQHNVECGAWFKDDHEKRETNWIRCTVTTRFGLRAIFWNTIDPGERLAHPDELQTLSRGE